MAQLKTITRNKPDFSELLGPRLKEGAFIALVATALFLTLALLSFDRNDPGWTYTGSAEMVNNIVGLSGAWIADVFLFFFGFLSYLFPMMLASQAWMIFRERKTETEFSWPIFIFRGVGLFLTVGAGTAIAAMHFYSAGLAYQYGSGGVIGSEFAELLIPVFSYVGATLLLLAMFLLVLPRFWVFPGYGSWMWQADFPLKWLCEPVTQAIEPWLSFGKSENFGAVLRVGARSWRSMLKRSSNESHRLSKCHRLRRKKKASGLPESDREICFVLAQLMGCQHCTF